MLRDNERRYKEGSYNDCEDCLIVKNNWENKCQSFRSYRHKLLLKKSIRLLCLPRIIRE